MNLLEIVLAFISLLYAIILYKVLTNIEYNDKKAEVMYKDACRYVEDLRQRHNSLIAGQKEANTDLLKDVDERLEKANQAHVKNYNSFLEEVDKVKQTIAQGFLRR